MAHPVVIAVRVDGMGAADQDIQAALHGPRIALVGPEARIVAPNGLRGQGLWHKDGHPRNQHVAGVLTFSIELRPWSITRQTPTLWLHPEPAQPLPDLPFQRARVVDAEIRITAGTFNPGTTFDLPGANALAETTQWPGEPFSYLRS